MENLLIRKLKTDELYRLAQLFDYKDEVAMIKQNARLLKSGAIAIYCIFDNDKIVGELRVKYKSYDKRYVIKNKRVYLYAMRISSEYQSKGVGTFFLEEIVHRLILEGYSEFTVGVESDNDIAKHIYKKLGFNDKLATITESYQGDSYRYDLLLKRRCSIGNSINRIMVIGSGGSGKSTLAVSLGQKLELPIIHLDKLYWKSGWVKTPKEEWRAKQSDVLDGNKWVVDGNYISSMDIRMFRSDMIIFLDINRWLCLYRVIKRRIKNTGKVRPDMGEGCVEKLDGEFVKWILDYPKKVKPQVIDMLKEYYSGDIHIFKSPRLVRQFLASINNKTNLANKDVFNKNS